MEEPVGQPALKPGSPACAAGIPAVAWCGLLLYGVLFVCAALFRLRGMQIACLPGVGVQALVLVLAGRRQYLGAGLLFSLQSGVYALLGPVLGVGGSAGAFVLPALMLQMLPYGSRALRRLVAAFLTAGLGVCLTVSFLSGPPAVGGRGMMVFGSLFLAFHITAACLVSFFGMRAAPASGGRGCTVDQLRYEAYRDALTGLYNRRYCEMALRRLRTWPGEGTWCVAMMDVDDFKAINDRYGHPVGDSVLRRMAGVISRTLRVQDYVFRWGGEEFLFLLRDVDPEQAGHILERIRCGLEQCPVRARGETVAVTVTIGAALLDVHDIQGSVDRCDRKMYEGKRQGKNVVMV